MTTLLVFPPPTSISFNLSQLASEITPLFQGDPVLSVSTQIRPFMYDEYLQFSWPDWSFSVFLERGAQVGEDANFVHSQLGDVFPQGTPVICIRISFGLDTANDFTNHIIWVWEHFSAIPDVVIYDVNQNRLWQ